MTITTPLGNGFYWNQREDGSAMLRNADRSVVLEVSKESVDTLRQIVKQVCPKDGDTCGEAV